MRIGRSRARSSTMWAARPKLLAIANRKSPYSGSSRSAVSATASAPSMLTATGWPTCVPTRAASARTAAAVASGAVLGRDVEQPLGAQVMLVPAMPDPRQPAAGRALASRRRRRPTPRRRRRPGAWPMIRIARVTTAPCSSPNDRMPPASALIGVARVEAIVRATSADGDSGPWSIAATMHAPSSVGLRLGRSVAAPQAQQHRRERRHARSPRRGRRRERRRGGRWSP